MNIDRPRPVITCSSRYGLVAEIATALMSVSMFLKDNAATQRTIWADRGKCEKNATETGQTKPLSGDNYLGVSSFKSAAKSAKGKDETEQEKEELEQLKATVETQFNFKNLGKKGAEFSLVPGSYLVDTIDERSFGQLKEIEVKKLVAVTQEGSKLEEEQDAG
ncbi:hypothetical protein L1887_32239 [Cichorium endivia]|nr:hypothetical protein L1887_32239 [Cichorium endivia]